MAYRFRIFFPLFLLALANQQAIAQTLPSEAYFNRYTLQDGLPSNYINGMLQDGQGFLWISTEAGLSCFDGVHFTNYFKGKDLQTSLPSNSINQLAKLPDGRIAIATRFGISLLDPVRRTFKSVLIPYEHGMEYAQNNVITLVVTSAGNIVAGSNVGICVFDASLNVVFQYSHFKKEDLEKETMGFSHVMMALSNGDVLIKGWDGFWRYDATHQKVEKQDASAFGQKVWERFYSLKKPNLSSWWNYFPDTLWIHDHLSGKTGAMQLIKEIKYELHWRTTLEFVNDTLLGLSSCNHGFRTAVFDPVTPQLRFSEQQIFKEIHFNTFLMDREGRWWLGSENGLYQQSFSKSHFRLVHLKTSLKAGGTSSYLSGITKVGKHFYVGANNQLLVLDNNLSQLKNIPIPDHIGEIWNLYAWQPGILDIGGSDAWIRLNIPEDWDMPLQWKQIGPALTNFCQIKDKQGDLWVGAYKGLLRYNPTTGKEYKYAKGQPEGEIPFQGARRMAETDSGYIWMCGLPGFTRWNPFTQRFDRHFPVVPGTEGKEGFPSAVANNGDEELLFTLANNGLWLWSGDERPARNVVTGNPALEFVLEIYPDSRPHYFWLILKSGLALLNVSTQRYKYVTTNDGLPDIPITRNGMYIDSTTDSIYLCYSNGILVFNQNDIHFSEAPALIYITGATQISNGQVLNADENIQLEQPDNDIAITFSSPDYEQGQLLSFAYRLNDGDWQSLGNSKSVRFVSLSPGEYLFEVKSITPEGVSSEPAKLAFEVLPYFYQTWWFIALVAAAGGLAAFGYFRWRLGQLRKMEAMRQAIAADLHDEVGASLTSIQILSQLASHPDSDRRSEALEKLPEQVRRTSASLREIVWNISPSHDSLDLLIGELTRYAGEVFEKMDIQYSVQADEFLEGDRLDVAARQHLQRIFKETLNNLAKHSQASRAAVVFKKEGHELVVLVRDDGQGFDPITVRRGNGLDNMQHRAMSAGGKLILRSSPNDGTETTLRLPLKTGRAWWKILIK